jgi:hypothetical protein
MADEETATAYALGVNRHPIEKLAAALVAAQKELSNPPKTRTAKGQKWSYKYADLADVTDVVRPVLSKHGLAMMHLMTPSGADYVLIARLLHESGQYMDSTYPVPKGLAAQDLGSWLTYMRRYSTCNMAFVAGETDEDGEAATAAQIAAEDAEAAANRQAAEEKLKALKAERMKTEKPDPNRVSAYDGRALKPSEDALPPKKDPDKNTELEPVVTVVTPAPDMLANIHYALANAMRKDKITVEEIMLVLGPKPKGFGYQPAGVHPEKWPEDFVMGITKEVNWKRIVARIRSA